MTGLRTPDGGGLPVAELSPRHFTEAAVLLARAFAEDPLWLWLVPDARMRERSLPWLFERSLADLREARLEVVGDPPAGVATWLPPSSSPGSPPLRTLVGGVARLRGRFRALVRYAREAARLEHEVGAARAWRLGGLAVDPSLQRRGHGSVLLRHGLARADAAGRPVVLLTSNPANIAFYERHGFAVEAGRPLPADGPPAWAMVRPARPPAPS